jgi:formylglycine-generating enzyme required for sulfatase activity
VDYVVLPPPPPPGTVKNPLPGFETTFEMVFVAKGSFTMGRVNGRDDNDGVTVWANELPAHNVTLTKDFYIGKYEVTQGVWEYVMGYSGKGLTPTTLYPGGSNYTPSASYGKGDNYPVYYVSWNDIVDIFIPRLNAITDMTFRLPTEAEWEYAARGGKNGQGYQYSGSNTMGDVAWYEDNSGDICTSTNRKSHPVGGKKCTSHSGANELGLYDMSGNVYEWCQDSWDGSSGYASGSVSDPIGTTGSHRMSRGGYWNFSAPYCRVASRDYFTPGYRYNYIGFRLVLVP